MPAAIAVAVGVSVLGLVATVVVLLARRGRPAVEPEGAREVGGEVEVVRATA